MPSIEAPGHTVIADTPIPIGTPGAPIQRAFGVEYEAFAHAKLAASNFDFQSASLEYQALEQSTVQWEWNISPKEVGDQLVNLSVEVQWRPTGGQAEPIERSIWHSQLDILVKQPLIPTDTLNTMSVGSGFAGLILIVLWLYQKFRGRKVQISSSTFGPSHVRLRDILTTRFSESELRTLCFDLNVDYESLPGDGKADKARELVAYLERHGRFPELAETGKRQRPDISWE